MNFFQQLHALNLDGDLKIVATRTGEAGMLVSVFLANDACGDKARNTIPPLLLRGTAEEIDEAFFAKIAEPMQTTSGLMTSMETYLKAQEEAKKLAEMNKPKTRAKTASVTPAAIEPPKPPTEAELKEQVYEAAMAKVDDLVREKKYREAFAKLPGLADYPDKADALRKKKSELTDLASQLFA